MSKLLFSIKPTGNFPYGLLAVAFHLKQPVEFVQSDVHEESLRVVGASLLGTDPIAATQIDAWIDYAHDHLYQSDFKKLSSSFDHLNHHLTLKSFMVGYDLTLADFAVWGALKSNAIFNQQIKAGKFKGEYLNRWYTFMGSLESVKSALAALEKAKDQAKDRRDQGNLEIPLPDAIPGKVVTRFPPEPSGYLHIGHAKAAMLNDYFARSYNGKLIVRFDDTNPSKEKEEYEESIKEDLLLLGIKGDVVTHTSDYFDHLYSEAIRMIKEGKAYVDDTDQETMRAQRFDGIESKNRSNSIQVNLEKFEEMKNATPYGLTCCLRAKIDMQDKNKAMRDPVIYRCNLTPHHKTGTQWKIYPTYDFACPIVDSLEGVTHALRTIEYRDRNAQYAWFLKALNIRWVHMWDYSRLNFVYTLLSKRKLTWFVDEKYVTGWDDPRFPTVRGIRRRGLTIQALRQYILSQGASQREILLEWDKLWATNKKVIDPVAPRHTAISANQMVTVNVLGVEPSSKQVPKHKKNPDVGSKIVSFSSKIHLEQEDAKTLELNEEITLMDWGNAFVKDVQKSGDSISQVTLELHLEGDFKKTKKKLTWLSADATTPIVLLDYDYLITKKKLEEEDDVKDFITPVTEFKTACVGDNNLKQVKKGDIIQFERKGYYICDKVEKDASYFIYIPDGKVSSLASKHEAEPKVAKKKKEAEPLKMYEMKSIYNDLAVPKEVGKMYGIKNVYGDLKTPNENVKPSKPQEKEVKQEAKKEKKEAKQPKQPAVEAPLISKLDIVVGKILSVEKHPDADTLYVEKIDVGEPEPRTVVSGLVKFMTPDQLQDRTILVLKNLKPVSMRGIKSFAMVLCASDASHEKVEFLIPPAGSVPGDRVYFEGFEGEPEAQLNPKKKVWEAIQPDFTTRDDLVAVWKDVPFRTAKGVVKTGSIAKASIK